MLNAILSGTNNTLPPDDKDKSAGNVDVLRDALNPQPKTKKKVAQKPPPVQTKSLDDLFNEWAGNPQKDTAVEKKLTKKAPQKLAGPGPTPVPEANPEYIDETKSMPGEKETALRQQKSQLEAQIRRINKAGYDVAPLYKKLQGIYAQLRTIDKTHVYTKTADYAKNPIPSPAPEKKEIQDKLNGLPFTMEEFNKALTNGTSVIKDKDGDPYPYDAGARLVRNATHYQGLQGGNPAQAEEQNVNSLAPNINKFQPSGSVGQQAMNSSGSLTGGLSALTTDRLLSLFYGTKPGFFINNPDLAEARKAQDAVTSLAGYFLPGVGQMEMAGQAGNVMNRAGQVGVAGALGEAAKGVAQSLNPLEEGLLPTERATRFVNDLLAIFGGIHGVKGIAEHGVHLPQIPEHAVGDYNGINPGENAVHPEIKSQNTHIPSAGAVEEPKEITPGKPKKVKKAQAKFAPPPQNINPEHIIGENGKTIERQKAEAAGLSDTVKHMQSLKTAEENKDKPNQDRINELNRGIANYNAEITKLGGHTPNSPVSEPVAKSPVKSNNPVEVKKAEIAKGQAKIFLDGLEKAHNELGNDKFSKTEDLKKAMADKYSPEEYDRELQNLQKSGLLNSSSGRKFSVDPEGINFGDKDVTKQAPTVQTLVKAHKDVIEAADKETDPVKKKELDDQAESLTNDITHNMDSLNKEKKPAPKSDKAKANAKKKADKAAAVEKINNSKKPSDSEKVANVVANLKNDHPDWDGYSPDKQKKLIKEAMVPRGEPKPGFEPKVAPLNAGVKTFASTAINKLRYELTKVINPPGMSEGAKHRADILTAHSGTIAAEGQRAQHLLTSNKAVQLLEGDTKRFANNSKFREHLGKINQRVNGMVDYFTHKGEQAYNSMSPNDKAIAVRKDLIDKGYFNNQDQPVSETIGKRLESKIGKEHWDKFSPEKKAKLIEKEVPLLKKEAYQRLRKIKNYEQLAPFEDGTAFNDAHANDEARPYFDVLKKVNEYYRKKIQDLGPGHLDSFIENYLSHTWKDPDEFAKQYDSDLSKKNLEGNKNFLKQRSVESYSEGIKRGLEPLHNDPITAQLHKLMAMDKYIESQNLLHDDIKNGDVRYVQAGAKMPAGFGEVPDKLYQVHQVNDPVTIHEVYDAGLHKKLVNFAKKLGVNVMRDPNIDTLGNYNKTTNYKGEPKGEVNQVVKNENILKHELAHHFEDMDVKDSSGNTIKMGDVFDNPKMKKEMDKLALNRYVGDDGTHNLSYIQGKSEAFANLIHSYMNSRDLLAKQAPKAFKALEDLIKNNPILKPLKNMEPTVAVGEKEYKVGGNVQKVGTWAMPKDQLAVVNRYMSPSFNGNPLMDSYTHGMGAINNLQLFSARHAIVSAIQSNFSDLALGGKQIIQGHPLKGLGSIIRGGTGFSAIQDIWKGSQLTNEYFHNLDESRLTTGQKGALKEAWDNLFPGSRTGNENIIKGIKQGNLQFDRQKFYQTNFSSALSKAIKDLTHPNTTPGNEIVGKGAKAKQMALAGYSAGVHLAFGGAEKALEPILAKQVPLAKAGAFSKLFDYNLEQAMKRNGGTVSEAEFRSIANKASNDIMDRFGELAYDNLFLHNTFKSLLLGAFRAVGYNVGSGRLTLGGISDIMNPLKEAAKVDRNFGNNKLQRGAEITRAARAGISDRTAYLGALVAGTAFYGYLIKYLTTQGKKPPVPKLDFGTLNYYRGRNMDTKTMRQDYFESVDNWKDLLAPTIGGTDKYGEANRIQLPTYTRDIISFISNPLQTVQNKLASPWENLAEIIHNKDFSGKQIYDPHDHVWGQAMDALKHTGMMAEPFSIENAFKTAQPNQSMLQILTSPQSLMGFAGINKASQAIKNTPAMDRASDIASARMSSLGRTAEQVKNSDIKSNISQLLRQSALEPDPKKSKALQDEASNLITANNLTNREALELYKNATKSKLEILLKSASPKEGMQVWDVANEQERAQINTLLLQKLQNAANSGKWNSDYDDYLKKLQDWSDKKENK